MNETSEDGFLGGRLRIMQPVRGYRAGADAVMLAAACPARPGQSVLELGCGAGVASLCLGWRVADLRLTGLEQQPAYAELARHNVAANGIAMTIMDGDLADPPACLRGMAFDHVIANPPFFIAGTAAPEPGRAIARQEDTPLASWIDSGLRRLRPGGTITMIQRADRLDAMISGLAGRVGAINILPIAARRGSDAGRVLLGARKGARTPLRLLHAFVMHAADAHSADREDLTPAARAILRDGAPITALFTKVP